MRAYLFASGRGARWGSQDGFHKHLLSDGEQPVILRTVKQLLARDIGPIIVTPHEPIRNCVEGNMPNECAGGHVAFLNVGQPELWADTALATMAQHTVAGPVIGIMADVFFSDLAMDTIAEVARTATGPMWFGRAYPSRITGGDAEIFAWSHRHPEDASQIVAGLEVAAEDARAKNAGRDMLGTPMGSPWQARRATLGRPLVQDPDPSTAWVEINDFTDDWDDDAHYTRWQAAYRKRIIRQPKFSRAA